MRAWQALLGGGRGLNGLSGSVRSRSPLKAQKAAKRLSADHFPPAPQRINQLPYACSGLVGSLPWLPW